MIATSDDVRLTGKSIGLLEGIGRAVYDAALEKAVQHAARSNRSVVNEDDVRAGIRAVLGAAADQFGERDGDRNQSR